MTKKQIETISLNEIDFEDAFFRMSKFFNLKTLKLSILKVGILNSPLVRKKESGKYQIISGYKRLLVCKNLDMKNVAVCTLSGQDDLALFQLALYDNLSIRHFNLVEKALITDRLISHFKIEDRELYSNYFSVLGLGNSPRWKQLLQSLKMLSKELQEFFSSELLSFDLIKFLSTLEMEDQNLFCRLYKSFKFGKNRQKELILMLTDLSKIKKITIPELLKSIEVQSLSGDTNLTPSQKTERLFAWLHEEKYPVYTEIKKSFNSVVQSFELPSSIRIKHSPFFERDEFFCDFKFKNEKDFQKIVKKLSLIQNHKNLALLKNLTDMEKE